MKLINESVAPSRWNNTTIEVTRERRRLPPASLKHLGKKELQKTGMFVRLIESTVSTVCVCVCVCVLCVCGVCVCVRVCVRVCVGG